MVPSRPAQVPTCGSAPASRPMKMCGLLRLSQRVSRARRIDSRTADAAESSTQGVRSGRHDERAECGSDGCQQSALSGRAHKGPWRQKTADYAEGGLRRQLKTGGFAVIAMVLAGATVVRERAAG